LTYKAGLAHDPENEELKDGLRRTVTAGNTAPMVDKDNIFYQRCCADPELMAVISDTVISQVLFDLSSSNRLAVAAHLQNPEVAAKLQKLFHSGLGMPEGRVVWGGGGGSGGDGADGGS
jgi:stress-induced-phosphoprotein 1